MVDVWQGSEYAICLAEQGSIFETKIQRIVQIVTVQLVNASLRPQLQYRIEHVHNSQLEIFCEPRLWSCGKNCLEHAY